MGLKRAYKPFVDGEHDKVCLETRRFSITDGVLKGSQIDVYDSSTIRIWTSQKKKAKEVGAANKFRVRLFDGEAELFIPAESADRWLHSFGAKVKSTRTFTPEQLVVIKARLSKARAAKAPVPTPA